MEQRVISIPVDEMTRTGFNWDIDWRGQTAGETTSGARPIVYNAFPRWVGNYTAGLHRDQITTFRARRARARGRVHPYKVPMIDPLSYSFRHYRQNMPCQGRRFVDGTLFTDETGFDYTPFWSIAEAAPAGSDYIVVDISPVGIEPILGGLHSIRLNPFIISELFHRGGSIYELGVEPFLRRAVEIGDTVELIATGLFFAEEDMSGAAEYDASWHSRVSMRLIEYLR